MQFELLLLLEPLIVQTLVDLLVDLRGGDGADGGARVSGRQGLGGVLVTTLVVSVLVRASNECSRRLRSFTITEKEPSRAFSYS